MRNERFLSRATSLLVLLLLLLTSCNGEPAPLRRVRAFHEAVNEIESAEETGGVISAPEGMRQLNEIYAEYTTEERAPMTSTTLSMAAGLVEFTEMTYELVSEDEGCVIVSVDGVASVQDRSSPFQGEYVVIKQGTKWLIDFNVTECPPAP